MIVLYPCFTSFPSISYLYLICSSNRDLLFASKASTQMHILALVCFLSRISKWASSMYQIAKEKGVKADMNSGVKNFFPLIYIDLLILNNSGRGVRSQNIASFLFFVIDDFIFEKSPAFQRK